VARTVTRKLNLCPTVTEPESADRSRTRPGARSDGGPDSDRDSESVMMMACQARDLARPARRRSRVKSPPAPGDPAGRRRV
jgi:hypothetical protein